MYIYIYIYIYSHPQTDCFVVSQLFRVAKQKGEVGIKKKLANFNSSRLFYRTATRKLS